MAVSRERAFQVVLSDVPGAWGAPGREYQPSVLSSLCLPGQWDLKQLLTLQEHMHSFAYFVPGWLCDYYFPLFLLLMWLMVVWAPVSRGRRCWTHVSCSWGGRWLLMEGRKGTLAVTTTSGFRTKAMDERTSFPFALKLMVEPKCVKLILKGITVSYCYCCVLPWIISEGGRYPPLLCFVLQSLSNTFLNYFSVMAESDF